MEIDRVLPVCSPLVYLKVVERVASGDNLYDFIIEAEYTQAVRLAWLAFKSSFFRPSPF